MLNGSFQLIEKLKFYFYGLKFATKLKIIAIFTLFIKE